MKIASVDIFPIMTWRPHLFVTVTADDGTYGVGESGLSWQERPIAAAIERFSELVIGEDPMRTEHLWQLMARASFFPADRINAAAISAIDLALWDLKGKLLGQPVYNLIGGLVRERIQCYPHNEGEDDPARLIDDIEGTVADGWRFARWGFSGTTGESFDPSDAVRKSVRAIEAVRAHFGPELELCVDVHTRIDLPDSLRYCRAVEDVNPYFIEDALRSERPESYRRLRERTSVPLAAGEQWFTKWGFATAIEEELIDYARIDLCLVGGFTEALKIARWAETHHIQIVPHNPLGPVSSAAGAQLTLAASNAGVLEMAKEPGTNLQDVFPQQTPFEHGHALPADQPGWGITFDAKAASKYPEPGTGYAPMLKRRDGSFTNW
jgi:galactonate dehydratase